MSDIGLDFFPYAVLGALIALVPVAVVVYLWVQVHALRRRVARLEGGVGASLPAQPRTRLNSAAQPAGNVSAAADNAFSSAAATPPQAAAKPASAALERVAAMPSGEIPAASAGRSAAMNWEVFAGGKMLNVVGGIVLVIGVGLLLKYAIDQNWIGATMRVLGGLLLGGALVAAGDRAHFRTEKAWFPQGLIGAGLGIMYLSGYASFGSYHLVPFTLAYAFMSGVTVAAFLLALRYDSLAIALAGWAGGFATPFVLADGPGNELGLASYLVLLDIGIAATALVKARWFALTPLALFASYFTAEAWYGHNGDPSQWLVSTIALASLWLVFFASGVAQALRERRAAFDWKQLLGVLNVAFFWTFAAGILEPHRGALETLALIAGAAYFAAWAALKSHAAFATSMRAQYAATSALLVALAAHLQTDGYALAATYALVALVTIVAEANLRKRGSSYVPAVEAPFAAGGFLALACAVVAQLVAATGFDPSRALYDLEFQPLNSADAALAAILVAALALERAFSAPAAAPAWLRAAARQVCVLAVLCLTAQHLSGFALVGAIALEALAVAYGGTRGMLRDLQIAAPVIFALDLLHLAALPGTWAAPHVFLFVPIFNERFVAFTALAAGLMAAGECYRRRSLLPAFAARGARALGVLTAVAGGTLDLEDSFARLIAVAQNEIPRSAEVAARIAGLTNGEQLAISGLWILSSLLLLALGVRLRVRDLRFMGIGLFDLTILKAFFVDLGSLEGLYRILGFIGLGLTLLLVSAVYQRLERGYFGPRPDDEPLPA
jgi:uncharacterized membrane protein